MGKKNKPDLETVYFLSLGCPKNRVDTEVMAGIANQRNLTIVGEPEQADVIIVNTCAFIESAKEESIEALLKMNTYRETGRLKKLVSAGCLSQRYGEELGADMPELDYLVGTAQVDKVGEVFDASSARVVVGPAAHYLKTPEVPRFVEPGAVTAYLKVGDGCSRKCSFCAIPAIRGKGASVPLDEVLNEARTLVSQGVKELVLVAQDLTAYGRDLPGNVTLQTLLSELNNVPGLAWIRLLYLYPGKEIGSIVEEIRNLDKVVPYIDIPVQHAAENMLQTMRRGHGSSFLKKNIASVRETYPGIFLRTSVLVGHPGETNADFDALLKFLEWADFDRLGAFRYSDEEGTHAHTLESTVSKKISYNRWRKVMALGRRTSRKRNKALIGQTLDVLVESPADDQGFVLVGRHQGQSPEIDGVTYILSSDAKPGDIIKAKVVKADDFDLVVEPVL